MVVTLTLHGSIQREMRTPGSHLLNIGLPHVRSGLVELFDGLAGMAELKDDNYHAHIVVDFLGMQCLAGRWRIFSHRRSRLTCYQP